ncbi:MAG: sugar ABC transporter permease [Caldilineaceae bacterium]
MIPFLGVPRLAMPSIAMINIWQYVGYTALLIFAGEPIHSRLGHHEAASIDGASQTFWQVTVPLLRHGVGLCTGDVGHRFLPDHRHNRHYHQGRPGQCDQVLNWYIYEQAFTRFNMGYATTISIILAADSDLCEHGADTHHAGQANRICRQHRTHDWHCRKGRLTDGDYRIQRDPTTATLSVGQTVRLDSPAPAALCHALSFGGWCAPR